MCPAACGWRGWFDAIPATRTRRAETVRELLARAPSESASALGSSPARTSAARPARGVIVERARSAASRRCAAFPRPGRPAAMSPMQCGLLLGRTPVRSGGAPERGRLGPQCSNRGVAASDRVNLRREPMRIARRVTRHRARRECAEEDRVCERRSECGPSQGSGRRPHSLPPLRRIELLPARHAPDPRAASIMPRPSAPSAGISRTTSDRLGRRKIEHSARTRGRCPPGSPRVIWTRRDPESDRSAARRRRAQ
jgi:hypothetical protein